MLMYDQNYRRSTDKATWDEAPPSPQSPESGGRWHMVRYLDGTMHLVNYHLGGSLYTMAAITVAGGLPQTTLLMAVSAVLTCVVYMNLADVATHQGAGSLCRIVSSVLGRKPALVLRVLIMLNALGVIVAYTQACLDIYSSTQSAATTGGFVTFVVMLVIGCTTVPVLECLRPDTADHHQSPARCCKGAQLEDRYVGLRTLLHCGEEGDCRHYRGGPEEDGERLVQRLRQGVRPNGP